MGRIVGREENSKVRIICAASCEDMFDNLLPNCFVYLYHVLLSVLALKEGK